MKNLASAVGILAVMISAAMVCGDDLRLKNGKVYKNYRIKSIQNGVAEVLFLSDDNKPDSVRVSQTVLPDEVLKKYSALIKDQSLGRQMPGWVKGLEKSLSALDEKERAKRSLLLTGFRKQLAEAIAKEADMADFTVVANDKNGAVAQVVGSYPDSKFKSGQYVFIAGKSIREFPIECKSMLAYIPDNPDIYEFMTGIQYLNFVADIFKVDAEMRNSLIRKYADMFEITSELAQPVKSYSHGMKQKLVIISALIHNPKLIIMDEPFVGLDPKASHLLKGIMRDICDNGGAIFFSTHVLEVAEKLCDKIAIIKDGRLLVSGTTDKVKGNASLEKVFLELGDNNA